MELRHLRSVVAIARHGSFTKAGEELHLAQSAVSQQLAGLDLVTYRENSALRRRLELAMGDHGLTPRNAFICTEMGAVRALVSKGMGVAVIPRSAVRLVA